MPWRESLGPVRMQRVALVATRDDLRALLVRVADAGFVELDEVPPRSTNATSDAPGGAAMRLRRLSGQGTAHRAAPTLSLTAPDLDEVESSGRFDLLAGEAELEAHAAAAVSRGDVAALAGWMPRSELPPLRHKIADVGGGVVALARPRGVDPPSLLARGPDVRRSLTPLVETYGHVPYADLDPTVLASLAYVLMFGMMFGDAGHGVLLVLVGLILRWGRWARLAWARAAWPFVVGAGIAATVFGLLYGEFFGPTGVIPVLWLSPLEQPLTLIAAALAVGAVLLAGAYAVGIINRWREGGWRLALYAPSGIAGAALFLGLGVLALGAYEDSGSLIVVGGVVWLVGFALAFLGLWAAAGGGGAGIAQAAVELVDTVIRVGSNLASFARLAAFGLTHAALGAVIWQGTLALWSLGGAGWFAAVLLFTLGNAVAFALEALVAGVQALRLEYYELFSRLFQSEGRPFRPWHVPTAAWPTTQREER
jgi:V/A-type H+/Na+-transporting ATPase subunit I